MDDSLILEIFGVEEEEEYEEEDTLNQLSPKISIRMHRPTIKLFTNQPF